MLGLGRLHRVMAGCLCRSMAIMAVAKRQAWKEHSKTGNLRVCRPHKKHGWYEDVKRTGCPAKFVAADKSNGGQQGGPGWLSDPMGREPGGGAHLH